MKFDVEYLQGLKIEAFDGARHDRAPFTCGVDRLDNFLKVTATKFVKNDDGKIYVAIEKATDRLVGYYAIAPHAIDVTCFSEQERRRLPSHPTVSAFYLSMIATDVTIRGKGLGRYLLGDVFHRLVKVADITGGRFIVLDAINERAAKLYREIDFIDLPSHPDRMIISMAKVRKNAAAATTRENKAA